MTLYQRVFSGVFMINTVFTKPIPYKSKIINYLQNFGIYGYDPTIIISHIIPEHSDVFEKQKKNDQSVLSFRINHSPRHCQYL